MQEYSLMTTSGRIYFQLPDAWRVLNNVELRSEGVKKPIYELINDALNRPIGSLPLAELIKPTRKIVIMIDDIARPTPKKSS